MTEETTRACEKCGASVYREHLDSGIARYEEGRLLCSHCVSEYEQAHDKAETGVSDELLEPIALEDDDDENQEDVLDLSASRIHVTQGNLLGAGRSWDESKFSRGLVDASTPGATRCRTFHAKLNDNAVAFMNTQVNEWMDKNEAVIKFATSTIGVFEGKHPEPNLILTVFY